MPKVKGKQMVFFFYNGPLQRVPKSHFIWTSNLWILKNALPLWTSPFYPVCSLRKQLKREPVSSSLCFKLLLSSLSLLKCGATIIFLPKSMLPLGLVKAFFGARGSLQAHYKEIRDQKWMTHAFLLTSCRYRSTSATSV